MTATLTATRWIAGDPSAPAALRLFCFHHAGGGASAYRDWMRAAELPPGVAVLAVQLPGRENRFREPAFRALPPLVESLLEHVAPHLGPRFAFFGHSMGALVAFEFARHLRALGRPLPVQLFVSGKQAPHLPPRPPIAGLPDEQLKATLRAFDGTPAAVLSHPELLDLLLPILRADLGVGETYAYAAAPPLPCAITSFVGAGDPEAGEVEGRAWQRETAHPLTLHVFPGGHFFIQTEASAILRTIAAELEVHLAR